MRIIITQENIDKAIEAKKNLDVQACPIYQAVLKKQGNNLIGVSKRYIWLSNEKSYLLPKIAVDFILAFDAGKEVKPFSFQAEEC